MRDLDLVTMGCVSSKGVKRNGGRKRKKEKEKKKSSSNRLIASDKEEEDLVEDDDNGGNDATTRLISTEPIEKSAGSTPPAWDEEEKKPIVFEKPEVPKVQRLAVTNATEVVGGQPQINRVFNVRNGVDGAQVVAGWPSWLTTVASEAIKGWLPRKGDSFQKLDKVNLKLLCALVAKNQYKVNEFAIFLHNCSYHVGISDNH